MRWHIAWLFLCGIHPPTMLAQYPDSGNWRVPTMAVPRIHTVPGWLRFDDVDFSPGPSDSLRGIVTDLNGDDQPDFLIRADPGLCGASGNCALAVIDGATRKVLAILEGAELVVRPSRPGGWPVLEVVAHMGAAEALDVVYVHDGKEYRATATRRVEGEEYLALRRELDRIPLRTDAP